MCIRIKKDVLFAISIGCILMVNILLLTIFRVKNVIQKHEYVFKNKK